MCPEDLSFGYGIDWSAQRRLCFLETHAHARKGPSNFSTTAEGKSDAEPWVKAVWNKRTYDWCFINILRKTCFLLIKVTWLPLMDARWLLEVGVLGERRASVVPADLECRFLDNCEYPHVCVWRSFSILVVNGFLKHPVFVCACQRYNQISETFWENPHFAPRRLGGGSESIILLERGRNWVCFSVIKD